MLLSFSKLRRIARVVRVPSALRERRERSEDDLLRYCLRPLGVLGNTGDTGRSMAGQDMRTQRSGADNLGDLPSMVAWEKVRALRGAVGKRRERCWEVAPGPPRVRWGEGCLLPRSEHGVSCELEVGGL